MPGKSTKKHRIPFGSGIKDAMKPADSNSDRPAQKSSYGTFIIIAVIIIASIAAFLILRPNPSGTTPKSTPSSSSQ